MHETNHVGLDRHPENGGSKVATERTPAISGLAGSTRNFLAVDRRLVMISAALLGLDAPNHFTDDAESRAVRESTEI